MMSKALYKILLIGDAAVGKSQLMNRFCNNSFSAKYKATIGADFMTKDIALGETHSPTSLQP